MPQITRRWMEDSASRRTNGQPRRRYYQVLPMVEASRSGGTLVRRTSEAPPRITGTAMATRGSTKLVLGAVPAGRRRRGGLADEWRKSRTLGAVPHLALEDLAAATTVWRSEWRCMVVCCVLYACEVSFVHWADDFLVAAVARAPDDAHRVQNRHMQTAAAASTVTLRRGV